MSYQKVAVLCLILVGLASQGLAAFAQTTLRPLPPLLHSISDEVGVLSVAEGLALSRLIDDIRTRKEAEIIILIAETTQPESMDAYIMRLLKAWRIQTDRLRHGRFVFVVIAKDERILRVVPGPRLLSILKPFEQSDVLIGAHAHLKRNEYFQGLSLIVQKLSQLIPDPAVLI